MPRIPGAFLLVAALAGAAPASAQIVGRHEHGPAYPSDPFLGSGIMPGPSVGDELRDIDRRIDRGRASGTLSRREARMMRREARAVARLARRYGGDGLSASERDELETRFGVLRDAAGRPSPGPRHGR